jgi:hypothetical protein
MIKFFGVLIGFSFAPTQFVIGVTYNISPFAECVGIKFFPGFTLWIEFNHKHPTDEELYKLMGGD